MILINLVRYVPGYSTEKKSLWREMCAATKEQLSDPYLKAAFAFLVDQSSHYKHVLVSLLFFSYAN